MKETANGRRQTAKEGGELRSTKFLLPVAVYRLPSWVGSILFHTILLLLVLLWFSLSPDSDRGMPGPRNAVGTITLQPSGGGQQAAEETADGRQQTTEEGELEQITDIQLSILPVTIALAPGQDQNVAQPGGASVTGASAADLAVALQQSGAGIGSGIGAGTGEATIQLFGTEGTGTRFVYVFDRSTSMEGARIRHAKAELIRSLDSLGDSHQFNIIFYSGRDHWQLWRPPERGRRLLVYATVANKQSATRFVNGITAFGGTRHFEPLIEAINHRPDVIFFLTDGESQDDLTPAELREIERRNNLGRAVQINVIQFGGGGFFDAPSRSLEQLATDNHGDYRYFSVLGLR
jgi:hypothetical protein